MKADLLSSQPIDQGFSIGHFAATGLGIILQVLLLLHGSIIKRLKFRADHLFIDLHKSILKIKKIKNGHYWRRKRKYEKDGSIFPVICVFDLHSVKFLLFCIQLFLSFGELSLSDHQTSLLQSQVSL